MDSFIDLFLDSLESKNTIQAYKADIYDFISFLDRQIKHPNELTIKDLINYKSYLKISINPKYTDNSINRKLASLKSLMKWLYAAGIIDNNPIASMVLKKAAIKSPTQAFTDAEVKLMLDNTSNLSENLIITLLANLGLRRAELLNISVSDIQAHRGQPILIITGKGNKTRELPLTDKIYETIVSFIKLTKPTDKLFNTSASTIYRLVKKLSKICKIEKSVSPHSFRATAISYLLEQGVSIRNVANFAGHSNINTTLSYDKKRDGIKNNPALLMDF